MRIVAYCFDADHHCEGCTREAIDLGRLREPEGSKRILDENGIPEDLIDHEGNPLRPVFDHEEIPEDGITCGGCLDEIEAPRMGEALFDRFSIEMRISIARECGGPGRCDEPVERWVNRAGIAWEAIPAEDIREELSGYGAWDEADLADDGENRKRIFWLAACHIRESESE